jgi:2-iminobutanoate/2-iminopropanoate deaminase
VTKRVIRTDQAPAPFQGAPYSQGIAHGGFVFVSGQLGIDTGGNMVDSGISEQTEQVMKNLSAILEAAGTSLENVVKATIFLVDLGDFQAMNEVYGRHMGEEPPARATFQVAALPSGARVEIDVIAAEG